MITVLRGLQANKKRVKNVRELGGGSKNRAPKDAIFHMLQGRENPSIELRAAEETEVMEIAERKDLPR